MPSLCLRPVTSRTAAVPTTITSWRTSSCKPVLKHIQEKIHLAWENVFVVCSLISSQSSKCMLICVTFWRDLVVVWGEFKYSHVSVFLRRYVISSLELLVAEDYMIIYLNGATPRRRMPGISWLKRCYQMIDRRYLDIKWTHIQVSNTVRQDYFNVTEHASYLKVKEESQVSDNCTPVLVYSDRSGHLTPFH